MASLYVPPSNLLPIDVFGAITDKVAEERDLKTLAALSLVHSNFLDMCQRHLFSTIALLDSPRSLKLLAKALKLNARLALLVETLEVRITQELVRESQLAWVGSTYRTLSLSTFHAVRGKLASI